MNISHLISLKLIFALGCFEGRLASGKLRTTKDVAIALDELSDLAWQEAWDLHHSPGLPSADVIDLN